MRVDSPLLAVVMEIPVDLYDEEEVWENQTGIIATVPLSLMALRDPHTYYQRLHITAGHCHSS